MIWTETWKQVFQKPSGTDGPQHHLGGGGAPAGVIIGGRATQLGLECPLIQQRLALEQKKEEMGAGWDPGHTVS